MVSHGKRHHKKDQNVMYNIVSHKHIKAVPVQLSLLMLGLQLHQCGREKMMMILTVGMDVDPDNVGLADQHVEGAQLLQPCCCHSADLISGSIVLAELNKTIDSILAADLLLHHLDL